MSTHVRSFIYVLQKVVLYSVASSNAGADPGFLERGFVCINVLGANFADFISLFLNIP